MGVRAMLRELGARAGKARRQASITSSRSCSTVKSAFRPAGGATDPRAVDAGGIDPAHIVLPMLVLALTQYAWFTLFVRNTMLEVLREDHIGLNNTAVSQVALSAAPPERAGMASGTVNALKQIGLAAGVAILGTIHHATAHSEMLRPLADCSGRATRRRLPTRSVRAGGSARSGAPSTPTRGR